MLLWIALATMIALAGMGLAAPLLRRAETSSSRGSAAALLREQLAGVDAQVDSDAVSAGEADGLRLEIKRRLLAEAEEDPAPPALMSGRTRSRLAVAAAATVALTSIGIYASLGRPDLPSATPGAPEMAVDASAQGEALVGAAGGRVTPEAVALFRQAIARDPADPRARFYLALAKDQAGDRDGAMTDWLKLLAEAPADADWAADLRSFVLRQAEARGVDSAGRLPPARGPSAADVQAAAAMSPAEQQAMIAGMVDGLEARLREQPLDRAGWERLLQARMTLDQPERARAALQAADAALAGRPAERAALRETARNLRVPGA